MSEPAPAHFWFPDFKSKQDNDLLRQISLSQKKAMQCEKVRELREALVAAKLSTLDEQSNALGLCRSTAWFVMSAGYKGSGLSASLINRMLAAPGIPPVARAVIIEYVQCKARGMYGHTQKQSRAFLARLSTDSVGVLSLPNFSELAASETGSCLPA